MSLLRKIGDVALNTARRVTSYVIPESERRGVNNFVNWITGYVEPTQIGQVLDEVKEHVRRNYPPKQPFEMKKSASALKKFATQYVIEGREGFDPQTFLSELKRDVTNLLESNRKTKVKLILRCIMEKTNIADGQRIEQPAAFHSDVEVNLEGTDVNE